MLTTNPLSTLDLEQARPAAGEQMTPIARLTRDLKTAAATLSREEAAYLVQLFYEMQEQRIRAAAQIRMAEEHGEPNALLSWSLANYDALEGDIASRVKCDTQRERASQEVYDTHGRCVSHCAGDAQKTDASQHPCDVHTAGANHNGRDTHKPGVSHKVREAQACGASQDVSDSQNLSVSRARSDIQ